MKKLMLTALVLTLLSTAARAQQTPMLDVAGEFSAIQVLEGFNVTAYGGGGSVAVNVNEWLGAVGDFGLYHTAPFGSGVTAGTYMFGPRFSYRRFHRFIPFTQALVGGLRDANNGFAFGAGGGAEIGLDNRGRFALRPQVEYVGFRTNGSTTDTIRASIGLVFRIGAR